MASAADTAAIIGVARIRVITAMAVERAAPGAVLGPLTGVKRHALAEFTPPPKSPQC
jgi:hypothetical protein